MTEATTVSTNPSDHFAATYSEARARFLAAARARGLVLRHYAHPVAKGAQGEELALDVGVLGDPHAKEVLLLTAGTHGAEGFCGSGCEIGLLADDAFVARVARDGVRVVFLHALNPYGFSHLRRTNEDNVDLNRNFRDWSSAPHRTSPMRKCTASSCRIRGRRRQPTTPSCARISLRTARRHCSRR